MLDEGGDPREDQSMMVDRLDERWYLAGRSTATCPRSKTVPSFGGWLPS